MSHHRTHVRYFCQLPICTLATKRYLNTYVKITGNNIKDRAYFRLVKRHEIMFVLDETMYSQFF